LFAGKQMLDFQRLRNDSEIVRMQAAASEQKYQTALKALPQIPLSTDNLRALVNRYDELSKRAIGPAPAYQRLSSALAGFPHVELDHLNWTVVNHIEDAFVGGGSKPGAPAAANPNPAAAAGSGPFVVLDLYATLPVAMVNDHRGQLELINGLANRLRADPATQVNVLSLPFDAESGKALKSSGGTVAAEAPRFSLRVVQKL
jgi:hypothetical protein